MDPTIISIPVIVGIGGLAAAFTEFIKRTIIDKHIYQPTDPAHDTFVRGVCFVVALLLTVLSIIPAFPGTGVGWLTLLFQAAASAGISISGYHIVTGSASPASGTTIPSIDYAALAVSLEPLLSKLLPAPVVTAPEHIILPASAAAAPPSPNTPEIVGGTP
jgi:NADH:ubiquinone oxidoreductase subunit H